MLDQVFDATPDRRSFDRLDLIDEIAQRGIDDAAEFVSATGRIEKDEGTLLTKRPSDALHPIPGIDRLLVRHFRRSETMFPETLGGGVVLFPTGQSQFVGHEHATPLGISDGRPMTRLVQHRGIRGEGRIFGERQGLDRSHNPTLPTCPKRRSLRVDPRCLQSRTRPDCPLWRRIAGRGLRRTCVGVTLLLIVKGNFRVVGRVGGRRSA